MNPPRRFLTYKGDFVEVLEIAVRLYPETEHQYAITVWEAVILDAAGTVLVVDVTELSAEAL